MLPIYSRDLLRSEAACRFALKAQLFAQDSIPLKLRYSECGLNEADLVQSKAPI